MPFRKWARAARVGVVCLGKGSQGPAGMEPEPESMTTMIGESKFSLKVRVLSGSLRRNERASSARCEGGWTAVIAMILTMDRDFWPGSNCWARSSMRETPPRLVPGAADDRPLSASALVPSFPLCLLSPWGRGGRGGWFYWLLAGPGGELVDGGRGDSHSRVAEERRPLFVTIMLFRQPSGAGWLELDIWTLTNPR